MSLNQEQNTVLFCAYSAFSRKGSHIVAYRLTSQLTPHARHNQIYDIFVKCVHLPSVVLCGYRYTYRFTRTSESCNWLIVCL